MRWPLREVSSPALLVSNQQLLYPRHHRVRKIYIMLAIAGNRHIGHRQVTNAIFKIGDHLVAIDGYKHDIQCQRTRFEVPIEVLLELHQANHATGPVAPARRKSTRCDWARQGPAAHRVRGCPRGHHASFASAPRLARRPSTAQPVTEQHSAISEYARTPSGWILNSRPELWSLSMMR